MIRRSIYWKISCFLLLIFNVFLLIKGINEVESEELYNYSKETTIDSYQSSFIDLLENDGMLIQDMALLDIADNSVKALSELFVDDSVLFVCRVSQFQCQSCASYALEKAIELFGYDSIGTRLVFLCEYEYRSLKILVDDHPNLSDYCVFQASNINLPIETRIYPYFFTLSKDMKTHDVFLPNMDDPVKTEIYWDYISRKWK